MKIWTELLTSSLTVGLGIPTQEDINTTLEFHFPVSTEKSLFLKMAPKKNLRAGILGFVYGQNNTFCSEGLLMSFPSGLLLSSCWRCRIFSIIAPNFPNSSLQQLLLTLIDRVQKKRAKSCAHNFSVPGLFSPYQNKTVESTKKLACQGT